MPFNLAVSLYLKWISYRQHNARSCFLIHSANFYLLIGVFRLHIFNVLTFMLRFKCDFSVVFFFNFSFCFVLPTFLWVTWTFFRIPVWGIHSNFEYISLYRFLVVALGVSLYVHKLSQPTFYQFKWSAENLPPFTSLYPPLLIK